MPLIFSVRKSTSMKPTSNNYIMYQPAERILFVCFVSETQTGMVHFFKYVISIYFLCTPASAKVVFAFRMIENLFVFCKSHFLAKWQVAFQQWPGGSSHSVCFSGMFKSGVLLYAHFSSKWVPVWSNKKSGHSYLLWASLFFSFLLWIFSWILHIPNNQFMHWQCFYRKWPQTIY